MSLGVSSATSLRRCGDILMGHRCYVFLRRRHDVPIDVLATFHGDVVGCFNWGVPATLLGCTEGRRYDVASTSFCGVGYRFTYSQIFFRDFKQMNAFK